MEVHSLTDITMHYLLRFVFNKLSNIEMDKFELFLQKNDFYANIVDDLIDLVTERNFTFDQTSAYLKENKTNDFVLRLSLKFKALSDRFNLDKLSLNEFEKQVKQWFKPTPPAEFGVALMSDNLEVILPLNKKNYTNKIEFALSKPVSINDKVYLNIFESGNEIPFLESVLDESKISIIINIYEKKLHPGIYYWRMQSLQTGAKAEGEFYINKQLNPFEEE